MPMKTLQQTEHVLDASHRAAPIARVKATPLNIPIEISIVGVTRSTSLSVCLCEVETTDGLIGYGLTGITEEEVIAAIIDEIAVLKRRPSTSSVTFLIVLCSSLSSALGANACGWR